MDFAASSDASGDEQEVLNAQKGKKMYHRHTSQQIQRLEAFFKECAHPDENQRRQLSRELGLESKQIKFWFQNKRTQAKAQNERADNSILRAENERIQCENLAVREALKNVICPSCGGPPFGEEERQRSLQKLQLENSQLKVEHEKVSNLLAKYIGKPISKITSSISAYGWTLDLLPTSLLNQAIRASSIDLQLNATISDNMNLLTPHHIQGLSDMEKALMSETATSAMNELIRLLRVDEPLWIQTPPEGRYIINRENYEKILSITSYFKSPNNARVESSKDSGMVTMNAMNLVEIFLDTDKWKNIFSTIVVKARTLQELENGTSESRHGCLQLMYAQMHILSPLVPPREFYVLRLCQQMEPGVWVIAEVSYDCLKESISPSRSWKFPSGCMIEEMPDGCSKVTWVEHVKVDDKTQTHRLYRDLMSGNLAYGAKRWVVTLQRMCERLAFSVKQSPFVGELGGDGKRSIMKLGHRMVKNFCATLGMSGKLDFPQLSEVNNSGVRVSIRESRELGQPNGLIVSVATSLWLPLPQPHIFAFFKNEKTRAEWDVLFSGNLVHEIAHISTGAQSENFLSIIEPSIPIENNMVILQEFSTDSLGSIFVYAPIDIPAMNIAINGEDSSNIPLLPSGFIISGDGRPSTETSDNAERSTVGSLLTVAFQVLVSSHSTSSKELNMESVAAVNTLISSTVQKIKVALNCSNLD